MSKKRADKDKLNFKDVFKIGDVLIVVAIIVLVALTIAFSLKQGSGVAEIYVDGKLVHSVDLSVDDEFDILDGKMTVKVQNGSICVFKSDCKEQLCTHSSPIGKHGGTIVCLPNKVVVVVSTKEIDAIT